MQIGPIAVTFDAKNVVAYLVIDAKRATNEEAGCGKATGRSNETIRPIAVAGSETAIDTKIETGPIVDDRRQRGRNASRWKVGGKCVSAGGNHDCCCGNMFPPHATPLT